jgi:hypothetical protein
MFLAALFESVKRGSLCHPIESTIPESKRAEGHSEILSGDS